MYCIIIVPVIKVQLRIRDLREDQDLTQAQIASLLYAINRYTQNMNVGSVRCR